MLIDIIKKKYLNYFELREDNMLDIIRINTKLLDANNFLEIKLYLKKLEEAITNPSLFESEDTEGVILSRDYAKAVRNTILSFLIKKSDENGCIYLPLFLLHYSFPELKDFLTKWEQTRTDSPEFERLMSSSIYTSMSHMNDLPNFNENILNFGDKNHIVPAANAEEVKLEGESCCTRYFDEVTEKVTPLTKELFSIITGKGKVSYYDYLIVSKNRINIPNTTNFITVYVDDGSKILRPLPKTTTKSHSTSLVFIPKSIEIIGPSCFINLSVLLGIIFENGSKLKYIGGGRLFTTDFLPRSFQLPDTVEVIGDEAFMLSYCCIEFFHFPKNLRKIGKKAFYSIDKYILRKEMRKRHYTSLPEGVESIGDFAFATGDEFLMLRVNRSNIAGISLSAGEKAGIGLWSNSVIPSLSNCKVLTVIGAGAFRHTICEGGVLVIPPSVEEIGDYAFSGVSGLNKVIFSAGTKLKYLGEKAFFNCTDLSEVVFETPPPLERISYMAFAFTNLEMIDLSNLPNLKVIEACAFVTNNKKYRAGIIQPKIIKNPNVIDYGPFRVREWFKSDNVFVEKNRQGNAKYISSIDFEYLRAPSPKDLSNTYKDIPEITIVPKYERSKLFGPLIDDCIILEYLEYLNSDKYLNGESPKRENPNSFVIISRTSNEPLITELAHIIYGTYSRIL